MKYFVNIYSIFCRRLILSILSIFYTKEAVGNDNYKYSQSGKYFPPKEVNLHFLSIDRFF